MGDLISLVRGPAPTLDVFGIGRHPFHGNGSGMPEICELHTLHGTCELQRGVVPLVGVLVQGPAQHRFHIGRHIGAVEARQWLVDDQRNQFRLRTRMIFVLEWRAADEHGVQGGRQ